MSKANSKSNFYIVPVSNKLYNLHNQFTDNKILTSVNASYLRDFLDLNEPDHPFLFSYETNLEDSGLSSLTERLISRLDKSKKYNSYDPFYYTTTSPYGSDYNISYDSYGVSDVNSSSQDSDLQLSFSFMEEFSKESSGSLVDDKDNVLPFMPEDEWESEEED